MEIRHINHKSFGMALEFRPNSTAVRNRIMKKHSKNTAEKADQILDELWLNKTLTVLSLEKEGKKTKLKATVGDKVFKENFFNSPYKVLKKAQKESREQSQIELIADFLKTISKDLD